MENKDIKKEEVVEQTVTDNEVTKEKVVLYEDEQFKAVNYKGLDKNKKLYNLFVLFVKDDDLEIPLYPKDNSSAKLLRLHFQDLQTK